MEVIMGQLEKALPDIARCTAVKQLRLLKPILNQGGAGLAPSFEPAAQVAAADHYTYHHLRRDILSIVAESGVHPCWLAILCPFSPCPYGALHDVAWIFIGEIKQAWEN